MISPTSPACLRIRAFLTDNSGSTYRQIAAGAHVAESAVKNQYLPLLRRAGLIHFTGFLPTKGRALRLYAAGPQPLLAALLGINR